MTSGRATWLAWLPLLAAFTLLTLSVVRTDRTTWPFMLGDEATYMMAAESLAFDFDLRYTNSDYERFTSRWGTQPDLILHSTDSGETLTFGKPFLYPLMLAPFVRLSPSNAPALLNLVCLLIAAGFGARVLATSQGNRAPSLVVLSVFGSLTFAHTFWAHPDLVLFCGLAIAFALLGEPPLRADRRDGAAAARDRWALLAGLLIGIVAAVRPLYAVALLPALAAAGPGASRRSRVVAGCLAAFLVAALAQGTISGAWTAYGGERRGFTAVTGYPEVDFPAGDWENHVEEYGNVSWIRPGALEPRLDPALLLWDGIYFLIGRNVGLLPFFLPLFLLIAHARLNRTLVAALFAVALATLFLFALRPFNFYGGAGALGNRYFLPFFAVFCFIPLKKIAWRSIIGCAAVAALSLWPVWTSSSLFPLLEDPDGGLRYRYSTGLTARILPHETSQKFIRSVNNEDVNHAGTWIRFLDPRSRPADSQATELESLPGGGEILLARGRPFQAFEIEVPQGNRSLQVCHRRRCVEVQPGSSATLDAGLPSAKHQMWWPGGAQMLYRLSLLPIHGDRPVRFKIRLVAA